MDKKTFVSKYERQEAIHEKGFKIGNYSVSNYGKVRLGNGKNNQANDASVNLKSLDALNSPYTDKETILNALKNKDLTTLRAISDFYFDINGIYKRACEYIAYLNRYDYFLTPYVKHGNKVDKKKELNGFHSAIQYLDNSNLRQLFSDKSLEIVKHGSYYGYKVDSEERIILQDLPVDYCRSKYNINGKPAVEFNMKFFDDNFRDPTYREKILKIFPKEFGVGYRMYKDGLLPPEKMGEENSWYLLNPEKAVKFSLNNSDVPYLVAAVPAIIDLEEAKDIDRKKMLQQLMKVLVQKLPIDKNGDLVFDVDEAKDLHANAVAMLKNILGANVLTTFADIKVEDMDTSTTSTVTSDSLSKVERSAFDQLGISKNIFNTDGNTALDKSILDDEASVKSLVWQFERFINDDLKKFNIGKNCWFKIKILETTIYNYKELSKLYKEHVQLGYSKLLPQLALGHSQSEILAELEFEQNILDLSSIMVPAQMSSTMSGKPEDNSKKSNQNNNQKIIEDKEAGRKELPDDQKSDKTLANREAMG